MPVALDKEHNPFIADDPKTEACDIELDVYWAETLDMPAAGPSFIPDGLWSAFAGATGTKFYFSSPMLGISPYKAAWFDPSSSADTLSCDVTALPSTSPFFRSNIPSMSWP